MKSIRRYYLENLIIKNKKYIYGNILDIGGTKNSKNFFKSFLSKNCIINTLNTNPKTFPDILANIENYTNKEQIKYDSVTCFEVLEYIKDTKKFFQIIYRILKKESFFIFSVPFLHPIHGDFKQDLKRYTFSQLSYFLKKTKFKKYRIITMGSLGSVIYDILRVGFTYGSLKKKSILVYILISFKWLFLLIDIFTKEKSFFINTGYFVVAKK